MTNDERAARAEQALKYYRSITGDEDTDEIEDVTDFLTDLRHFCDRAGLDLGARDRMAHEHYLAELDEEETLRGFPIPKKPKGKDMICSRPYIVTLDVVGRYKVRVLASDSEQAGVQAINAMDQGIADIPWCDDEITLIDIQEI